MPDNAEFIDRLESCFAADDLAQARELIQSCKASDPVRHALGLAALAAHEKDAESCPRPAARAYLMRPDDPMVLQYMAIAALMRGDRHTAEEHARTAVMRGGGVRSLGWLGNIQLGSGK